MRPAEPDAVAGLLGRMWRGLTLRNLTGGCDDDGSGGEQGDDESLYVGAPLSSAAVYRPRGGYLMDPDPPDTPPRAFLPAPRLGELPFAPARPSVWTPWGPAAEREEDRVPAAPFPVAKRPSQGPTPLLPPIAPAAPQPAAPQPARRKRPLPAVHRPADEEGHEPAHRRRSLAAEPPPPERPRRMGRSAYDAVETHGSFGLIDTGQVRQSLRELVAHVPKRCRGSFLNFRPGDTIQANSARGRPVGGRLDVVYVTPHKYYQPGRAVTSCRLGVPDSQWERFADVGHHPLQRDD